MKPKIHFIVAMDSRGGIGKDNDLPWHLPEDLKRFKRLTMGHPMLMGRKTAQSLGRALPGRLNLVLTRSGEVPFKGMTAVASLDEAFAQLPEVTPELWVIGGAEIFRLLFAQADALYLTLLDGDYSADTFFPDFDRSQWQTLEQEDHQGYSYLTLIRKR